ncbi:MAG: alginate lyase family protein [Alphaproteobacteria bacterium]
MTLRPLALGLTLLAAPLAAEEPDCPPGTDPVVTLGFGSRYTDDSANRSDFDEDSDRAVTAALKPIDDFINDLARLTDRLHDPETEAEVTQEAAECVIALIQPWAEADALSDLKTQGANLSAPSRAGGIAFAYGAAIAARPELASDEIEDWLAARARQAMTFFDTQAPPRASQNNLRAWAGLAVTRIGLILDDPVLIDWGAGSAELVACTAAPDGSLPNEMWRGRLALHYQLHAVAPLVTTAALLPDRDLFAICDAAIPRIVRFTLVGLDDPTPVEKITGKAQSVGGAKKPRDFELAWVPAFLRFNPDPELAARIEGIEKLGNSKLGGDQRLLWPTELTKAAPSAGSPTEG